MTPFGNVCVHVCMYVCMYVCVYMCVCACVRAAKQILLPVREREMESTPCDLRTKLCTFCMALDE